MNDLGIEKSRLQIERNRFELEKRRAKREESLLNQNIGVIITAVVSIAAVIVSLAQLQVANVQKTKELELQEAKSQRDWLIEAAKFVATNKKAIFSEDDQERQLMRKVISVAFPKEVAIALIVQVGKVESGPLIRRFWKPDGTHINEQNAMKLKDWLKNNALSGIPLTIFLYGENFEDARVRAVKELNLQSKQQTITNVPEPQVELLKKEAELSGAAVVTKRQADGNWTLISTFH